MFVFFKKIGTVTVISTWLELVSRYNHLGLCCAGPLKYRNDTDTGLNPIERIRHCIAVSQHNCLHIGPNPIPTEANRSWVTGSWVRPIFSSTMQVHRAGPVRNVLCFTTVTAAATHRGRSMQYSLSLSSSLLLAKHSVECFGVFPTCLDKMAYAHSALKENKE